MLRNSNGPDGQSITAAPEPVARIAEIMSTYRPAWALCGGWAVDAWLGHQTRDHQDLDITVFSDDLRAIFDHLAGWYLIAHDAKVDGGTAKPWNGRPLTLPAHIHAAGPQSGFIEKDLASGVARSHDGFNLEVVLNERSGHDWIFSDEPRITMPVRRCVQQSAWGLPTVATEVIVFYKATAYVGTKHHLRPHDEADFLALLPLLTDAQRARLRKAVSRVYDGEHPWVGRL